MAAVPELGRATRLEQRVAPEAAATQDLYERYAGQIFSFCLHKLGNREEAEDAVQQTFLNAFRGLRRGIDVETESAWLFKIAHNVCLTRRRSAWRRGKVETPNDMEALQEFVAAPPRMGTDDLIQLQDALAAMPATQRKAILLREWQGLSYHEIAEQMEISQAAVETLIFRARRTLAQGLEQPPAEQRGWRRLRHTMDLGALLSSLLSGTVAKVAATTAAVTAVAVVPVGIEQNRVPATPSVPVAQQLLVLDEDPASAPVAVVEAEATPSSPLAETKVAPAAKATTAEPKPRQARVPPPAAVAPVQPEPAPAPAAEPPAPQPEAEEPRAEQPKAEERPHEAPPAAAPADQPDTDQGKGKAKGKTKHGDRAPQAANDQEAAPVVEPQVVVEEQPPPAEEPEPEHGGGKPDKPEKDNGGPKK